MENENKIDNGCKIFSIYFKNHEKKYDCGYAAGKAEATLEKIAQLGGTKKYYTSENLQELTDVFKEINDEIENNFGLKLKG